MKKWRFTAVAGSLLISSTTLIAQESVPGDDPYGGQVSSGLQKLIQYLQNFGSYIGYDLTQTPSQAPSNQLINSAFTQVAQTYFINTFFGAIPVNTAAANASGGSYSYFIPQNGQAYTALRVFNSFGNSTFNKPPYNSDATQQGAVTVFGSIDQKPYQSDPVSQSLLNILGTADSSYCMSYDGTQWTPTAKTCPPLTLGTVMQNALGASTIPSTYEVFSGANIMTYLPQLNSDALVAPLMYDTSSNTNTTSSSPTVTPGIPALTEAQLAANFIRYVTGSLAPLQLPSLKEYDTMFTTATSESNQITPLEKQQAAGVISNYLISLRTYTAQMSVAYSNLYYILSKRMPQTSTTGSEQPTSQAMNEFVMATWRLFNPNQGQGQGQGQGQSGDTQWLQKINNGSSATVQKEIAILLAEINYQLYLTRQQNERMLLTDSVALVKSNRATPPNPSLSEQSGK